MKLTDGHSFATEAMSNTWVGFEGDTEISKSVSWSVESYVAQVRAKNGVRQDELDMANALLIYGDSGLGKTHLSTSISKAVIERGFDVYYNSAVGMISDFEFRRFGNGVAQSYAEAVKWYLKASEAGHAGAQCDLGLCYELGRGVQKSLTEAVKWYRKSAEGGNSYGQCNYACMCENGLGTSVDISEALKWYQKAAESGNARGLFNVGRFYRFGKGVEADPKKGFEYYRCCFSDSSWNKL